MKKLHTVLLVCVWCFMSFNQAWAADTRYSMAHVCRTNPSLAITSVTITKDETILELEYKATGNKTSAIYPPGHDMAFFITDVSNSKKYNLLDSEGIAIKPNVNELHSGDVLKFKLVFEKIPMKRFHLVEGRLPMEKFNTWHFTNIKLP